MIHVRDETQDDRLRVFEIEAAAFPTDEEARLVDVLREEANPFVSLVAERDRRLIGHICFTPITLPESPSDLTVGGLAPVAVEPAAQGQGVGSALIEAGLERCRALGWRGVFLVGDPAYYGRFGFVLAAPLGFTYGEPHFDPALQVLELESGALDGGRGLVRYSPAFGQVQEG